ncbi:GAF domain-containing protein [Phyllobacterium phragmitis]|uniref:GAF domain-containing protein n=1 Tax=Phyllobacterium phragmitis TaxID=2670329 RepID=UPI001304E914|nr:GAF domain-containing protein [Phyllobacterium phragmitis]
MSARAVQVSANRLAALRQALSEPDQPYAALRVLDRLLDEAIGHKLFTALLYRPQHGMAERLYSSRPDVFPSHGTKNLADAPTMARVLTSGAPYVATEVGDIERDFPDHEKIFALGCGSILNVPVRRQGTVLGQVNLLHVAGHLRESHLSAVETMAEIVAPAFLSILNRG